VTETAIQSERVRDLNSAPRRLPIEIEGSAVHETILVIWSTFSPKDTNTAHELGPDWHEEVRKRIPDDLTDEIETLGGPYAHIWLAISSLLLAAPHPHDPGRVFRWLGGIDEQRLRRWILGYTSHDEDQALIEEAAEGDIDAAVRLLGPQAEKKPELVSYLEWLLSTDGLPDRFATALQRFHREVFSEYEEEFGGAIARAAAARKAAPSRGSATEVVEEVTSGIDFDIPLGTSRVVLVPSVVTRPLSLIDSHRGTLVVYYGIADEFIDADPEAPPSWLVRMYKALSDEKRLRILRRLSEGETSLDELTEILGLSKSTVHHHISQLRAAGLVRVHLPSDESASKQKRYTLREQSLADAGGFLDSYLRAESEQTHA
jgi:DNA-binding transcriptional ArsR family regulator